MRAPYAQPVLDASKLGATKRSSVDERIALVRERRLLHQQAIGIKHWDIFVIDLVVDLKRLFGGFVKYIDMLLLGQVFT